MARRADLNIALHVPDEYKLSRYRDKCDHAVVHARREPRDRECPRCGASGHVNGRSERKVYDRNAVCFTYKTVYGGKEIKIMQTVFIYNDLAYSITYTAHADRFDAHIDDVNAMLDAFVLR
jgi:hypothetical protein